MAIRQVLTGSAKLAVRAAIEMAWLTAARTGCILQLDVGDVHRHPEGMAVTFRRGKGVLFRGPHTAHTAHGGVLDQHMTTVGLTGRAFPGTTGEEIVPRPILDRQ